jgi:isoamylase
VLALRARQKRAFLVTLLLSGGVPLLLGGDELGRTQRGNNNAYCQDNAITWFDWTAVDDELVRFTREVIGLRRRHPVFRRRRYLVGRAAADLQWFTSSGAPMTSENWADPLARSVALFIDGATDPDVSAAGMPLVDNDFLVLLNSWWEPLTFRAPVGVPVHEWEIVCDTCDPTNHGKAGETVDVGPRSILVLRSPAIRG